MKKIILAFVLVLAFLQPYMLVAQDLLKSQNLSAVIVDNLKDTDILKIKAQLKANNLSIDQAETMALSKGMSATEFGKLKLRLQEENQEQVLTKSEPLSFQEGRVKEKAAAGKVKDTTIARIFGTELFDNPTLNFEPDLKLATPVNYVLGPGDELQVAIYGVQEYSGSLAVSPEGKVSIPYVGQLYVSGMTVEAATAKIKGAVAKVYSTVRNGQSTLSVSLGRIRTIKITVIGGKQPGNYSVSSLGTVYHALHLAGGPGINGSFRNIELIRNNKLLRNIDLYRFLVSGNASDNIGLKDNDVIRIPSYSNRVTIEGEVKRAGIFELKSGESFKDLLRYASGFTDMAYTASVQVLQKTAKELKVEDIKSSSFGSYLPKTGDFFKVAEILNRFENKIAIQGAVFRPSIYSFYSGMRVMDLIKLAEGLKEDAYLKRARISRLKSDLTTEVISIALDQALNNQNQANILLQKDDEVTIYSVNDFVEDYVVTIEGEIKKPGAYAYLENLTLNDLLIEAGGLKDAASKRVEIARMKKAEEIDDKDLNRVELIQLDIDPKSNEQLTNFSLQPFDVVTIRRIGLYEKPQTVSVEGAVAYPGKYVISTKNETIYDVISRAGGLLSKANIFGVKVIRSIKQKQINDLKRVNTGDESNKEELKDIIAQNLNQTIIPIDWDQIEKDPRHRSNIVLQAGDKIQVADYDGSVKVSGNVVLMSEIPFHKGKGFAYYFNAVGGVDDKGWKKKSYIVYPNGKAATTSSFLFFTSYPKVIAGSQIIVPEKPERQKMTTGEWVSIGSVITSLALLVVTAFK
ncbi:SLBB domain-containing protein [Flavobacterium polysaccharolyticum]|uniref:SLBB domain-containing protein n=1 Tax=Flavobacterium polysaccharolyticum TaxID=3133148 RepID=A0ABU9NIY3_9FLAO